jgi:hypothetical protein
MGILRFDPRSFGTRLLDGARDVMRDATVAEPGIRARDWLVPAAVALGSLVCVLALSMRPPASGPVALLFPPWWSPAQSMIAASGAGSIVRFGAWPFVVVVVPDGPRASLSGRSGAWLVLDPRLLGGCGQQIVRKVSG